MKEKLKKEDVGFTQIKNEVANDTRLSFKARGIFLYIFSKPDDWEFSVDRIAGKSDKDGFKAVNEGVKELEEFGYLERTKLKDGRKIWNIKYTPKPTSQNGELGKKPTRQKAKLPKRQPAKMATISNKELNTNKELDTNKEDTLILKTQKFVEDFKNIFNGGTIRKEFIPELQKFVEYWTEPNKSRTKLRWELEPTWKMSLRFKKWMRNKKDWSFEENKNNNKYQVVVNEQNL